MKQVNNKISFLILVFIFYGWCAFPQNSTIDSLKKVLLTQKEDTNKVNTLNELSINFFNNVDYKNAMQKAKEALTLSGKINFINGKGAAFQNIGLIYEFQNNNLPEARKNYYLAIKYYEESGSKNKTANEFLRIASSYNQEANSSRSVENIYLALKLFEETGDKEGLAQCYLMLGGNNFYQKEYPGALKNLFSALKISEEIGNKDNIAAANSILGNVYIALGNYEEALKRDSLALKNYGPQDAGILRSIGQIYEKQGSIAYAAGDKINSKNKFNESLNKYLSAIKSIEGGIGAKGWIADTYTDIATLFIKLNDLSKAKFYLEKSLNFFNQNKINLNGEHVYMALAKLDSARGDFTEAYKHYKMYISYRDSSFNEETTKRLQQVKMQYEFDKKEAATKAAQDKKDDLTRRTRNLQYFAIGAILLIAFSLYINSRQKQKAKSKIEKAYSELKSTQAQLIQSEKMASLGELTAGIAHEIQNPLNFVNNFSEVNKELLVEMKDEMDKGNLDDAKAIANDVIDNEEKINHHGKRADTIVKGMLQHSRSSTGQKESTDINALADEYLRLAYHGVRAKDNSFNVTMKTDFDEGIGNINIIPQDIGRVLLNLYNNAFYAVNEKKKQLGDSYEPTVSVSTKKVGDKSDSYRIEVKVKDNGNGIPQKVLDKIFQPFFTTKPTGQGTGLGLSLSYDIVKAHGGEIKIETKDGEYAEFIIILQTSY
jgi:two-component system NtrC family sensor kinase